PDTQADFGVVQRRSQSFAVSLNWVPSRPRSLPRVYNRVYLKHGCLPEESAVPPTPNGNASPPDLGGVIEQEQLPAGCEELAEPLIAHSQRERLLVSMADSCARKGYGATTIADICETAGVSRATFYELFKDKEDCFHASMEVALADAMGRIVAVYSPDKPWATMVRDAAAAFLDLLASRPSFARMALVEAPSS